MAESLQELLDGLKAAAQPSRLRILAVCAHGELTVSEITGILGQSQPRVSRHLKVLLSAGLLMRFRERHCVLYRVPDKGQGLDLVRRLLELLPERDETVQLDLRRLEAVKSERARVAARYLRFNAEDWAQLLEASVGGGQINRAVLEELGTSGLGDLLDVGTGTGRMLKLLRKYAENAQGVDISAQMLTVARSNLHAAGLDDVMVRQGDMYNLPFADGSFDTVTVDQVLYQAEHPTKVVAEAARLLRPGGRLLVVDFARTGGKGLPGDTAMIGLGEDDLRNWLQRAGLACTSVRRIDGESLGVLLTVARREHQHDVAA